MNFLENPLLIITSIVIFSVLLLAYEIYSIYKQKENFQKETLIPKKIVLKSQRKNSASKNKKLLKKADESIFKTIKTNIRVISKSKGGTRGPKQRTSTPKEKLDVMVSNLRRWFYHQPNVDANLAERLIDIKLKELNAREDYNYTKSKRREPKNGYAPLD